MWGDRYNPLARLAFGQRNPDMQYAGGSPDYDERTGRARNFLRGLVNMARGNQRQPMYRAQPPMQHMYPDYDGRP